MDQRTDYGGLGCWLVLILVIVGLATFYIQHHPVLTLDTGGSAQYLLDRNAKRHEREAVAGD